MGAYKVSMERVNFTHTIKYNHTEIFKIIARIETLDTPML